MKTKMIRKLGGIIAAAVVASNCLAAVAQPQPGQVQLAWDASPTPGVTYRLYAYTNATTLTNLSSAPVKLDAKTNLTATVQFLQPGTWRFVATAYSTNGIESVPSNEVIATVPPPPANARTVIVQFNATVTGTNWLDAGFFRIKFGD